MSPAQLVVFIEKPAGECMTPSPSEEKNWSQKGPEPCALVVKGQSFIEDMMNLVVLFTKLKFLELWLSQKRLPSCCAFTCGKSPKHFVEEMNFETRNAVEPVYHQNRTKRGSRANWQRWGALVVIDHYKFSAKVTHTPGILTPSDFHPDRSGGHVVPG